MATISLLALAASCLQASSLPAAVLKNSAYSAPAPASSALVYVCIVAAGVLVLLLARRMRQEQRAAGKYLAEPQISIAEKAASAAPPLEAVQIEAPRTRRAA